MIAEHLGLLEMLLVFGAVLGLAGRELWGLRHDRTRERERVGEAEPGPDTPPPAAGRD